MSDVPNSGADVPVGDPPPVSGQTAGKAGNPAAKRSEPFPHIVIGALDVRGQVIRRIYSKTSEDFAVYLAEDAPDNAGGRLLSVGAGATGALPGALSQVRIEYSDDPAKSAAQFKSLAPLRALRGEIDGLQDMLITALAPEDARDWQEAESFNRQVADALVVALQGYPDYARDLLELVRKQLLERLGSLARFQYCGSTVQATGISVGLFALLVIGTGFGQAFATSVGSGGGESFRSTFWNNPVFAFVQENHLWVAAIFGSLGAWFSIALGIRARTYALSNRPLDNLVDSFLRVVIALISAIVILSIVRLNLVTLSFGGQELNFICPDATPKCTESGWYGVDVAIILSFLAGFSERLVGSILGPATPEGKGEPEPPKAVDQTGPTTKGPPE